MRSLITMLSVWCAVAGAFAQQAPFWTIRAVPEADATAFAFAWTHGFDDDDDATHGLARVVADCRLDRARAAAPGTVASGVRVFARATIAFVVVRPEDHALGLRFCAALADDAGPSAADPLALALARAALAADDAAWLYPGSALQCRARRALCEGPSARPVAGTVAALQGLQPAAVRVAMGKVVPTRGLVLGAVSPGLAAALAGSPAAPASSAPLPPQRVVFAGRVDGGEVVHPRADAPLVALAFPVAPTAANAALAVGVEVARGRAARRLRLRGKEFMARAPLIAWSWVEGDPLLMFCRRGVDFGRADAAAAEIDGLVADLVASAPTDDELDIARRSLQQELLAEPWSPALRQSMTAEVLPGRATTLLLAAMRGVDPAGLADVTGESARAAIAAVCGSGTSWRGAVVPSRGAGLDPFAPR